MMCRSSDVFIKTSLYSTLLPFVLEHLSIYGIFLVVLTDPYLSVVSNSLQDNVGWSDCAL